MILWLSLPVVCLLTLGLAGGLRRYALARQLLDIPNERSSHEVPTPRGGGVAFVLVFLACAPLLASAGLIEWRLGWALLGAGGCVAVLGLADDHRHIAARWRLLGHFVAAFWAIRWLGGLPPIELFGLELAPGWLGDVLAALFLVWMINLYNFMDGIDGIAGIQAVCVTAGAVACYALIDVAAISGAAELVLLCAVAGFLYWNFPAAKLFMGDAGSGFLGLVLGVLALAAAWQEPRLLWCWLILLGVFVVDATFTLLRRLLRGEAVYQAHRSHAYQIASRRFASHVKVSSAVAAIDLFWLLPLALAVASGLFEGSVALVIAYLPLLWLAGKLGAGAAACHR